MRLSTVRITFLTFVLSLATLWVIDQQDQQSTPSPTSLSKEETYSWKSSQSTSWKIERDQPGQQTSIQTETWRYLESTKQSHFTQPVITLTKPDRVTVIRSQRGESQNDEIITLSGDVVITQNAPITSNNKQPSTQNNTLKTQNITYNASLGELNSHDTITITNSNGVTTGVGLKANLESGHFQLMSEVKGTYYPNPK